MLGGKMARPVMIVSIRPKCIPPMGTPRRFSPAPEPRAQLLPCATSIRSILASRQSATLSHARCDGQHATAAWRVPRLIRADRAERAGLRARTYNGALGHALAGNELQPDGSRPDMVRARRKPATGILRRRLDALDFGSQGQGRRDDERLFALLTTEPSAVVAPIHPKPMPVILTKAEQIEQCMSAPIADALGLQLLLPDHNLRIVARGQKSDPRPLTSI
jgi:hypothetical protein